MSESPVRICPNTECAFTGAIAPADRPKPQITPRGAVLEEARKLTEGDRNRTHGDILSNHQAIADAWNWWLRHRRLLNEQVGVILPSDVAEMMSLLKKGRKVSGHASHHDHGVDDCAYTAIAQELREMGH